jgi:Eco57I restriction-modification methylase
MQVKFPSLIKERNLIEADFFDKRVNFAGRTFDLVVGNPPWESQLTVHARAYLNEQKLDVGDKQIAQAFLWHAPDFCATQGKVALLCSSKNLLFNRSAPNLKFRQKFFRHFTITQVFDFSALRRFLFEKAIHPTTAIFYTPRRPNPSTTIFYGAPKPTHMAHRLAALILEPDDLKYLPLQQVLESVDGMEVEGEEDAEDVEEVVQQPLLLAGDDRPKKRTVNIWKVALWGTSYDYILLQHLNKYPTLREAISQKKGSWISKVGFNHGGPGEPDYAPWLDGKLCVMPKDFTRYGIDTSKLQPLPQGDRYYRRGISEQFKAPLVLFKRTQVRRQIGAAYLDQNCAYSETFTCIAGPIEDRNLLKAVTALLNSELAQYYLFLTTASWGVEREEVKAGEMKTLPFPFFDVSEDQIASIAHLVDELSKYPLIPNEHMERDLNKHIYKCFHLNEQQVQHIQETIEYTIKFFHGPENSAALEEPSTEMKKSYARSYIRSLNFYLKLVNRKLSSTVYVKETTPLSTIKFALNMLDEEVADIQEQEPDDTMRQALANLDKLSTERIAGRIYHRRNFRIYDGEDEDILYRVKPAERRQWTIGAAYGDAERTLADVM